MNNTCNKKQLNVSAYEARYSTWPIKMCVQVLQTHIQSNESLETQAMYATRECDEMYTYQYTQQIEL